MTMLEKPLVSEFSHVKPGETPGGATACAISSFTATWASPPRPGGG